MIWRIALDFHDFEDAACFLMILKMTLNFNDYAGL